MRLITLNVRGANRTRKEVVPYQVTELMAHEPDFVALSEVDSGRFADYRYEFERNGLDYVLDSVRGVRPELIGNRRVGTLIASRFACTHRLETQAIYNLPWPERLLSVAAVTNAGIIEINVAYIPYYYQGDPKLIEIKVQTLNGLYNGLAHASSNHRIVCGDFNIPFGETETGELICFGSATRHASMHEAEYRVLRGLAAYDLHDVFRTLHGHAKQQFSWHDPRTQTGFRLDHVLASKSLNATGCEYLHDFRAIRELRPWGPSPKSLTDHSALEVRFDPVLRSQAGEPALSIP